MIQSGIEEITKKWREDIVNKTADKVAINKDIESLLRSTNKVISLYEFNARSGGNTAKITISTSVGIFHGKYPEEPPKKIGTRLNLDMDMNSQLRQMWFASDNFIVTTEEGGIYLDKYRDGESKRFITEDEFKSIISNRDRLTMVIPKRKIINGGIR
jgi:hypothetical protein